MRILSVSPFHDSSVVIINDGKIEYFCKEERLTRSKRDWLPIKSLIEAFSRAEGQIDLVVICSPTGDDEHNKYLEHVIKKYTDAKVIRFCEHHHLAHASLAFYDSGFDKALVVVIDRAGAKFNNSIREGESIFIAEYPNKFTPVYKSYWAFNTGSDYDFDNAELISEITKAWPQCEVQCSGTLNTAKVYESATTLIGQHPLENGKTMGLAAYGVDRPFKSLFGADNNPIGSLFSHYKDFDYAYPCFLKDHLTKNLPKGKIVPPDDYQFYADYAYQVQKQTQESLLKLIKRKVEETGIDKVCITGGYGLNVVANEYFVKSLPNVEFFFEPISDDTGNSIGSALYVYRNETRDMSVRPLSNLFFNHVPHEYQLDGISANEADIATLLSQGKIVAVYNGQAEAGPRALGNRSILFDPRNTESKRIINKVKNREWYRPFAGSVLKNDVQEYFETHGLTKSPFMTVSFQVTEQKKNIIPGIVHVDGSCRIQTVDELIPHFYNLLTEFKKITGVSVLLNTSFNLAGEALVETPEDAIETFNRSNIDVLWFPEKGKMLVKDKK
jgi:carbamoyltransferase